MLETLQHLPALGLVLALIVGSMVGSFLNVVILRLPPRLEWEWRQQAREILALPVDPEDRRPPGIVRERSHCPACGGKIKPWENVPVFGWLLLRGRCSNCGARISVQYPLVEALTGLLSLLVIWHFGVTAQGLAALLFSWVLIAASGIDARTTLLPDQLTLPLLWLGLVLSVWALFVPMQDAILGAVVGYLSLWSVYWGFKLLTGKEGMGYGDFKLMAALGAWMGWQAILPIVLLSSLVGVIIGGGMLALRGQDRAIPIPFGPYIAIAGFVWLLYGEALLGAYLRLAGLS